MSERPDPKDPAPAAASASGPAGGVTRRFFLQGMGVAAGAVAVPLGVRDARAESAPAGAALPPGLGPDEVPIELLVNGQKKTVNVEPRTTLLDALRESLDMTGSKKVCDRGACGACTVELDGESVCSCMLLAADARGKKVTTIEGLAAPDGTLNRVQAAFIEHDALQCGFCTPGFIMRSHGFLAENPKPTLDDVKHGLAGNICRCGTYTHIFAAVLDAAGKQA